MPDPRDLRGRSVGGRPVHSPGGPPMPHRTRADERAAEIDISPTKLVADIEALKAELETTKAKADEYLTGLQRERAEFTNFRRRTAEEREQMLGLAGEDLLRKGLALAGDLEQSRGRGGGALPRNVLAPADECDLAIDTRLSELAANRWVEGVTASDRKLRALPESGGVRGVEAEPGRRSIPASTRRSSR